MNDTYAWHEPYKAAVLETDWTRLGERIQAAESAIADRLRDFSANHGGSPEENQAILDAMNGLGALRSDLESWRKSSQAS